MMPPKRPGPSEASGHEPKRQKKVKSACMVSVGMSDERVREMSGFSAATQLI